MIIAINITVKYYWLYLKGDFYLVILNAGHFTIENYYYPYSVPNNIYSDSWLHFGLHVVVAYYSCREMSLSTMEDSAHSFTVSTAHAAKKVFKCISDKPACIPSSHSEARGAPSPPRLLSAALSLGMLADNWERGALRLCFLLGESHLPDLTECLLGLRGDRSR